MILSEAELAAIRERCEKATPGPWTWDSVNPQDEDDDEFWGLAPDVISVLGQSSDSILVRNTGDRALISHARADIHHLLETLSVYKEALELQNAAVSDVCGKDKDDPSVIDCLHHAPKYWLDKAQEEKRK